MQYLRSTLLIGVILFILVSFASCDKKKSSKDKHLNKHVSDKEHETSKKPVKNKTEKSEDKHLDKHTSEHEASKKPIKDVKKSEDKHLDKHTSEHKTAKKPIKDEKKDEEHETTKKLIKDEKKSEDKHASDKEHETSKKPVKDKKKDEDKHLKKHASEHETSKKPIEDEKKDEDKHLDKHTSEHETSKKPIKDEKKGEDKHLDKHTSEHETSKKPIKDEKKGEDKHLKKHASEHETSKKPIEDEKKNEDKHLDKHTSEHETSKKPIKDEKKGEDKHLDKHTSSEHETSKKPIKDEKKGEDKNLDKHTAERETSTKPITDEKKDENKHLDKPTSEHETSKKPIKDEKKSEDKPLKKHASEHETSKKLIKDEKKGEVKSLGKNAAIKHEIVSKEEIKNSKKALKGKSLEKNAAVKHEIMSKKEIKNSKKALKVEVTIKKGKTGKKSPTPDVFSHSFEDGGSGSGEGNKCNKPIDLVVALDSSESIREANWTKLLRFTKDLMKSLDPSVTRIAIIRYNAKAEVPVPLGFFQSFEAFSTTIDGVFYEPGGTRTDVALSKALAVFASGGQRRASKILLVVTDNPTNDIRISKDYLVVGRDLVEKPSENLKSYEVITFGVGVKYGLTEEERGDLNQELAMITQDEEGDKRIVEVENFEELLTSANKVAGKICLVNGGWSSWTPWSQCTASCGGGTKVRLRRCDNPIPSNNGTNCTELGGSSVETRTCNIYPCSDGIEVTSMSQRPLQNPSRPLVQSILFSKDCPNGFDFVYLDSNQMSASSVYSRNTGDQTIMKFHAPGNGILYNVMNAGAWCAEHSESVSNCQDQYLQADLKIPVRIAKIGTQGEAALFGSNWVTFYKFNYSVDGRTWKQHKTILTGNMDRDTVKENLISPPVIARYVRFNPVHWNVRGGSRVHDICLRVGVFTCTEVKNIKHVHKKVKRALTRPRKYRLPY